MDATTAETITAIGTGAAAVGTVGALIFAAVAARAASKSAAAANAGLQSEIRPLLLDVPYEPYPDGEHEFPWPGEAMRKTPMRGQIIVDVGSGRFVFPVRNVGRGVARVESVAFALSGSDSTFAEFNSDAIPVGEDAWLAASIGTSSSVRDEMAQRPSLLHGPMPYILMVTYTDIAGQQRQRLELGIGTVGQDSALRVIRIEHIANPGTVIPFR